MTRTPPTVAEALEYMAAVARFAAASDMPFTTPEEMQRAAAAHLAHSVDLAADVLNQTTRGRAITRAIAEITYDDFHAEAEHRGCKYCDAPGH